MRGTSKGDWESWASEVGTKPVKSGLLATKGRKNFKNGGHDHLHHIRWGRGSGHWGYQLGSRGNLHRGSSGSSGHQCLVVVSLNENERRGSTRLQLLGEPRNRVVARERELPWELPLMRRWFCWVNNMKKKKERERWNLRVCKECIWDHGISAE